MEGQQIDANVEAQQASAPSETSALENAFNKITQPNQPQPSAETIKTDSGQVSEEDKAPWHKDPRWQKWQEEKKAFEEQRNSFAKEQSDLKSKAEYAAVWQQALQSNPQLAKHIIDYINGVQSESQKSDPQLEQYNAIASQLLKTPAFQQLFQNLDQLKNGVTSTAQQIRDAKYATAESKYHSLFNELATGFEVVDEYKPIFDKKLLDKMYELSPQTLNNLEFDPNLLRRAFEEVKKEYESLTNSIASRFTNKALNQSIPRTQTSGQPSLTAPKASVEEGMADLASQLKALSI